MIELTIDDSKRLNKLMSQIPKEFNNETKKSINKALTVIRKPVVEKPTQKYRVKKSDIKQGLKRTNARSSRLEGRLEITSYKTAISKMKLSYRTPTNQNISLKRKIRKLIKVSALKKSSVKIIKDEQGKSKPFVAQVGKHLGVFRRLKGKKTKNGNESLEEIFNLSPSEMVSGDGIPDEISEIANRIMNTTFRKMIDNW